MRDKPLEIKNLPYEVEALWRLYLRKDVEFWRCLGCGGEYPRDLVVRCVECCGPTLKDKGEEEVAPANDSADEE